MELCEQEGDFAGGRGTGAGGFPGGGFEGANFLLQDSSMSKSTENCELPGQIDRHLASLSKLYALDGKRELQELIVNAQIRVHEGWDYDNWNGGTYGHALYLLLPEQIFLRSVRQRESLQSQIRDGLNDVHNVQNESVSQVFFEMDDGVDQDWRGESGLLLTGKRSVSAEATSRIWEDDCFRLFLSHKSAFKKETAALKTGLRNYGISSFVAHEDIHPTEAWQVEIENALTTMDGFLAVMTEDFHDSEWTDQEVGFAFARRVPMVALRLGKDPYGFIGKFQGLKASWIESPLEVVKLLIRNDRMFTAWLKSIRECWGYDQGNRLADLLPLLQKLTEDQVDELIAAYNAGGQITGSYGFNGTKSRLHGPGLPFHLNRLSSRQFEFSGGRVVEIAKVEEST